jgi:hypothetical protein
MILSPNTLEQVTFVTRVSEDGDLTVTAQINIDGMPWTVIVMDPESMDDPDDPTSGSPAFFKRLLIEEQFQIVFHDSTMTIELY